MLERLKCCGMVICQGNHKLEPIFCQMKAIAEKNESLYLGFAFRAENKNVHKTNTKDKNTERKRKADFLLPLL